MSDEIDIQQIARDQLRAIECVNALDGIRDPERFVREAKAAIELARRSRGGMWADILSKPDEIARLADEWTEEQGGKAT